MAYGGGGLPSGGPRTKGWLVFGVVVVVGWEVNLRGKLGFEACALASMSLAYPMASAKEVGLSAANSC